MVFATGGFHGLRYVPEVTWGTTPATPAMVDLRHTSCSLVLSKDSFESQELRNDRQITDLRVGAQKIQGDIAFELSYGEFDPFLEAALFGAWNTDVLKAGTTAKFFTIERAFSDIGVYGAFTGCMVASMALSLKPNAIVTGSFNLIGKGATYSGTPLDASTTPSQTNPALDAFSGSIKEGGSAIAVVTGIDLQVENGLEAVYVVGSNVAAAVVPGRCKVTGTVSAYFENQTLLNKFINETASDIEVTLGNGTAKSYKILLPEVRYAGADNPVSGEGPVVLSMPFQAVYDTTEATSLKITRIP